MPIVVTMPALSPTMKSGNLVKWCKNVGDKIAVGDVIAEIDTDKATMEVESLHKGILAKILIAEGTHDVAVKSPIAVLKQPGDTDEDIASVINDPIHDRKEQEQQVEQITKQDIVKEQLNQKCNRIFASPLAKNLAQEHGIDLSKIQGTGPYGRIVKDDLKLDAKTTDDITNDIDLPVSRMRRTIAERLTWCKQNVPHFTLAKKINATALAEILEKIKQNSILNVKITPNEFIIKAVAQALSENRDLNIIWQDDHVKKFCNVDIAVAIAVQDGLLTPVIRDADKKSIGTIAKEVRNYAERARNGKLTNKECVGGAITISNLGMMPLTQFSAVINPPQSMILAVPSIVEEPVVVDGKLTIGKTMMLTLSVDHRAIDGKPATILLCNIATLLENPLQLLIMQ